MARSIERRAICKTLAAFPLLAWQQSSSKSSKVALNHAEFVASGQDRFGTPLAHGFSSLDYKVSSRDTNGPVFVMEHVNLTKGGPPRHLHHEQEEWFYLIDGELIVEVGTKRMRLKSGDSVLAPRKIPHSYAYVGEKPGRLLIAFFPAGKIEAFFREPYPHDAKLFRAYDMDLVGPPLSLE